jgi:hypothetical protein
MRRLTSAACLLSLARVAHADMMRAVLVTSCAAVLFVPAPQVHAFNAFTAFTCADVRAAAEGYLMQQIVAWAQANLTLEQMAAGRKCFVRARRARAAWLRQER